MGKKHGRNRVNERDDDAADEMSPGKLRIEIYLAAKELRFWPDAIEPFKLRSLHCLSREKRWVEYEKIAQVQHLLVQRLKQFNCCDNLVKIWGTGRCAAALFQVLGAEDSKPAKTILKSLEAFGHCLIPLGNIVGNGHGLFTPQR